MNNRLLKSILLFLSLYIGLTASAQQNLLDSSIHTFMLSPSAAYQVPGGNLSDRFGKDVSVGASFSYKSKSNWVFGIDGNFIFGGDVLETGMLDSISTNQGYIIGTGGIYANVRMYERGFHISAKVGRLVPVWGPNPNSGPLFTLGVGLLQHKIRIENPTNDAPQLSDEYLKGYDRLTNGLAITEFAGYQYLGNNGRINFFAGFEFIEAFTQNRRDFNFDTMQRDDTKRFDMLSGIRAGWIFTFYKRKPKDYYIN